MSPPTRRKFELRLKFVDLTFVKVLLLLFFQENKRSLGRRLKVLILTLSKSGARPILRRADK
jgi:hypothetical protein